MRIHLATESLKIKRLFRRHNSYKYIVKWTGDAQKGSLPSAYALVKVSQELGHLLGCETTGERRHHSLALEHHFLYFGISGRGAAGQRRTAEDSAKIRRRLFEAKVVFLVAVGAANIIIDASLPPASG
jgi:hypothetical protein